jgi:hypothetical protein
MTITTFSIYRKALRHLNWPFNLAIRLSTIIHLQLNNTNDARTAAENSSRESSYITRRFAQNRSRCLDRAPSHKRTVLSTKHALPYHIFFRIPLHSGTSPKPEMFGLVLTASCQYRWQLLSTISNTA